MVREVADATIDSLRDINYASIGISCYSPEYQEVCELIERIRKIGKRAHITVGGIHPTLQPEDFKGIADEIVVGRRDVGTCAYDLVDMEYYCTANPYAIRGVFLRCAYVLTSFGCPSACTFCVAKALRQHYGVEQFKTPQKIYEEVTFLKERYAVDGFYIIDDLFTLQWKKVIHFCTLIEGRGLLWGCNAKIGTLNEETVWAMARAGCIQIDFGVERGSNEELARLKKGQTVEQIKEVFGWCKKYKIRTFANFIVNIPNETARDREDIVRLAKEIKPTVVSINIFRGYLGTELPDTVPTDKIIRWVEQRNKEVNGLWRNLLFYCRTVYIIRIIKSRRRGDYFKQINLLIREVINQKWPTLFSSTHR